MDIERWDPAAANNTEAPPDGAPEHMFRSKVNDCLREVMAAVRRWNIAPEYANQVYGYTVSKEGPRVVKIADVDVIAMFPTGKRIRVSPDGSTWTYGYVVSASKPGSHTLVTVDIDPNLGYGELAYLRSLTFADVDPDTITSNAGTPFASLVDGDRVRVKFTEDNDGIFELDNATGTVITLAAGETLTDEGPISAKIYQETGTVPAGIDRIQCAIAEFGSAAARDVGITAGDIPTVAHLGTHVLKAEGSGGGINADRVDSWEAAELAGGQNLVVNGDFQRWQEGTSWVSPDNDDDTYVADQMVVLSEGNNIVDVTKATTGLPSDVEAGITFTWKTADKKAALYQMVEYLDCQPVLGGSGAVSLSFRVKRTAGSSPLKIRASVIAWNGSPDGCTSDPISAWPAAGFDPTLNSNFDLEKVGEFELDGTWQTIEIDGTEILYANAKNIGFLIWSDDDTIAVNDAITIGRIRLVPGDVALDIDEEPAAIMMARTHRYFCKTFSEDVAPQHAAGDGNALRGVCNNTGHGGIHFFFPVRMRTTPNISYWNPINVPSGAEYIYDATSAHNQVIAGDVTYEGFNEAFGALDSNAVHYLHVSADARFF